MKEYFDNAPDNYDLDDEEDNATPVEEDDDEVYSIEEEEDIAQEEETEAESGKKKKRPPHPSAWRLLFGMMTNPVEGWKNIRRASTTVDDIANECFYPLLGTAAVSNYVECIWKAGINLDQATVNAIKTIVAFFFGYFLVMLMIRTAFPKSHKKEVVDSDYGKKYVMFNIATLAVFDILYNCLPMIGPVLVFLPLWTVYLVLRGARFFMLPMAKASLLKTLLCVFIVGSPIAVYWILDLFI